MQQDPTRRRVLLAGSALVVLHLGFRAWALYPSWFVGDDYRLLAQARRSPLDIGYLMTPFDGHLMPLGRLLVWLVARTGDAPWVLTATLALAVQAVAVLAFLWMLVTLFGTRWSVVGLLALYLTSAVPLPTTMWWAAWIHALPVQAVLFAAVGTWVRYLRSGRSRWLAATGAVLVVGLSSDVRSVLVFGVLAWLLLAYFTPGRGRAFLASAVRSRVPGWALLLGLGGVYTVLFVALVPSPASQPSGSLAVDLARVLLGRSLVTGLFGGPWRWDDAGPPVVAVAPPGWTVVVSWVVLVAVVVTIAAVRRRTGRAWTLLGLYAGAAYVLLLASRAPAFGPEIGTQLRYLSDVQPVAVLCLGLALLPLDGAVGSSTSRPRPREAQTVARRALIPVAALVCAGGLLSSTAYVRIFHDDNPGAAWAHQAMAGLPTQAVSSGSVTLADQTVPESVMPGFVYPANTTRQILPVLVDGVSFPDVAEDLVVLTDAGEPRRAVVDPAVSSPAGPEAGCGWRVSGPRPTTIPLEARAIDYVWWVRIGYLGSAADAVTLAAGDTEVTAPVRRGLHNLFVRVTGQFDTVRLSGLARGSTLCVDVVEVGDAVPGGAL